MNAERPLSEQYRVAAKTWVELDSAASLLEETKSAVLSQRMKRLGDMPVSRAELEVKASEEWTHFVTRMVRAREAANLARVRLEWIRMRFSEWNSVTATRRAEMKL
jgi:hypothetical protein